MSGFVFRVDAGRLRGLGHLQRCLSLAAALQERGRRVTCVAPDLPDVRARIEAAGCLFIKMVGEADAGRTADWEMVAGTARAQACRAVVVDSYDIGAAYVEALRRAALFVVAIDDPATYPLAAHVVVNGGAGAETLNYDSSTGDTRFLLGPRYALLGRPFWSAPLRSSPRAVRTILVAVGGGDDAGLLRRVLQILNRIPGPFSISVVVGPFADVPAEVPPAACRHAVRFVRAPLTLSDLMRDADLAVSAAGQTLYELAAVGTPAVGLMLFDNQALNLRHLAAAGTVADAGRPSDHGFEARLEELIAGLIADEAARAAMGAVGQRLVDGQGAIRVAEVLTELA